MIIAIPQEGGTLSPRGKKPDYKIEDRGYITPCWIWQKNLLRGYGTGSFTTLGIKTGWAHRAYYIAAKGEIPAGLLEGVLDHLCRVPACVNPGHLEYVPHKENVRRGNQAKLTMEKAQDIRARAQAGEPLIDIAEFYGVDENTVGSVVDDWSWREDYSKPRQPTPRPVAHCLECDVLITSGRRHKKFCCPGHRRRFNNRKAAGHV